MKKTKQILAIIGVVLLVALYVSTLVFALIGSDLATNCLKASIYATVVVPVLIWAYTMVYRLLKNHYSLREDLDSIKKKLPGRMLPQKLQMNQTSKRGLRITTILFYNLSTS